MNCEGCGKTLAENEGIKINFVEGYFCDCGTEINLENMLYCSKNCIEENCYWLINYVDSSIVIKEDCDGCCTSFMDEIDVKIIYPPGYQEIKSVGKKKKKNKNKNKNLQKPS